MKLGNFFTKPKLPATSSPAIPASPAKELVTEMVRRKSLSVDSSDIPTTPLKLPLKREKTKKSDYERKFLPFQPPSYTTCAPVIPYPAHHDSDFDNVLERVLKSEPLTQRPPPISSIFAVSKGRSRGLYQPNAREVIESLNGSSQKPIDLESGESHLPHDLLKHVTIRHLHFAEDVRPPYVGSYTKRMTPPRYAKLRRNPFKRLRKDTNYDYDSEAEWEEPEEGEDILSDGEEDDESIGAPDEMEDFLDEDEAGPKRRLITGDLMPLNTGLCWEGTRTTNLEPSVDLDGMKLEFFIGKYSCVRSSANPDASRSPCSIHQSLLSVVLVQRRRPHPKRRGSNSDGQGRVTIGEWQNHVPKTTTPVKVEHEWAYYHWCSHGYEWSYYGCKPRQGFETFGKGFGRRRPGRVSRGCR